MAGNAKPAAGRIVRGVHVFPLRVYYEDTDVGGVVYYANYLKYAERARTEMMHLLDGGYRRLVAGGKLAFAVRRCEVDFLASARLDDILEVRTAVTQAGGASVTAEQVIRRGAEDITRLSVKLACVAPGGRAIRIPPRLKSALARVTKAGRSKANSRQ